MNDSISRRDIKFMNVGLIRDSKNLSYDKGQASVREIDENSIIFHRDVLHKCGEKMSSTTSRDTPSSTSYS